MKRSTLVAVLVTAAVLVVAGNLPRLPWESLSRQWRAGAATAVAAWPTKVRLELPRPEPRIAAPRGADGCATRFGRLREPGWVSASRDAWHAAGPVAFAVSGAFLGLLLLAGVLGVARRAARDTRATVLSLARAGRPAAAIARTSGLPRDAVSALLAPESPFSRPVPAPRGPRFAGLARLVRRG
ncbi:MAG: hypothetical protein U1E86_27965 [Burkholderiaceae bacterium]